MAGGSHEGEIAVDCFMAAELLPTFRRAYDRGVQLG
jgi:hypothetical protein